MLRRTREVLNQLKRLSFNKETDKIQDFLDSLDTDTHDMLLERPTAVKIIDLAEARSKNKWLQDRIRLDYRDFSGIDIPKIPQNEDRALKLMFL